MKSKEKKEEKPFWMLFENEESFADTFDPDLFDQACQDNATGKEKIVVKAGGQDFRKKKWAPQKELDLHGYTGAEAESRAESFIQAAHHERLQVVRIITGKGLHSDGPPVLPGIVEQKMYYLKEQKLIRSFFWEKKRNSSGGALIVLL